MMTPYSVMNAGYKYDPIECNEPLDERCKTRYRYYSCIYLTIVWLVYYYKHNNNESNFIILRN